MKYAVRIGDIGIEFDTTKEKENFLKLLSKASAVSINKTSGIVYEDKENQFGLYERDSLLKSVRCCNCYEIITDGTCRKQEFLKPYSYSDKGFTDETGFICDKCLKSLTGQVDAIKTKNKKEKEDLGCE